MSSLDAYFKSLKKIPVLSAAAERDLFEKYAKSKDPAIREKILASNLRFVVKIAHRFKGYQLPIEDLVQEGNIGMMFAFDRFDPSRGYKFISYAVWWIRSYIQKYVFRTVLLVNHFTTQRSRSEFFKTSASVILSGEASMNKPVNVEDELGSELGEFFDSGVDTEEEYSKAEIESLVRKSALSCTRNPRECCLLKDRVLSWDPKSLKELGGDFGVSRERVRQIEGNIIDRMREDLAA